MGRRKQPTECRVFLSHSTRDQWVSERVKDKIEGSGASVWLDAFDLPGGSNIRERIKEGMRSSTECLILLSPASLRSPWIMTELGMADGLGRQVLPVTVGVSKRDLPEPLKAVKTVPFDRLDIAITQHSETLSGTTGD